MAGTPELIAGVFERVMSLGTGSSFGIRLIMLSNENGKTSLKATSAQRIHVSHLGAFLRSIRKRITASII